MSGRFGHRLSGRLPGRARHRHAQGVTLVESLAALTVLSVGMLGIAGLFVHNVRNTRSALLRTQAVNLVADMSDRIRANASAGAAYNLIRYGGTPALRGCAPGAGDSGTHCSTTELAEDDLARWLAAARLALPPGRDAPARMAVEYAAPDAPGEPERFRVAVFWDEHGGARHCEVSVSLMPRPPVS